MRRNSEKEEKFKGNVALEAKWKTAPPPKKKCVKKEKDHLYQMLLMFKMRTSK